MGEEEFFCAYCGKHQEEVKKLISGIDVSSVYICNECVARCNEIIEEEFASSKVTIEGYFLEILLAEALKLVNYKSGELTVEDFIQEIERYFLKMMDVIAIKDKKEEEVKTVKSLIGELQQRAYEIDKKIESIIREKTILENESYEMVQKIKKDPIGAFLLEKNQEKN
jgi:hypothetical protein